MHNVQGCIDATLTWEQQIEAAKLAREEREDNKFKDSPVISDAIKAGFNLESMSAVLMVQKKWQPGRKITVGFFDGSEYLRGRCFNLFEQWENYAWIYFDRIDSVRDADIRVSFERGGSWSYVGTDCLLIPKDQATMQLGWAEDNTSEEELRRVCVHEMGHTLGLGHEHQHPNGGIPWNKERVYEYYAASGWTREDVDQQVFNLTSVSQSNFSNYDPLSIMHYPVPAQLLTDPSRAVGWNTQISAQDAAFMQSAYAAPSKPKPKEYKPGVKRRGLTSIHRTYNEPQVGVYKGKEVGYWEPK